MGSQTEAAGAEQHRGHRGEHQQRHQNQLLAAGEGALPELLLRQQVLRGTGRVIADIVSGKQPDIDISGLNMARYASAWRG